MNLLEKHLRLIADDLLSYRQQILAGDPSLLEGIAGVSLFAANYYTAYGRQDYLTFLNELIEEMYERISNEQLDHTLSNGMPGILYTLQYLQKDDFLDIENDPEIDQYLSDAVNTHAEKRNFDLLHGYIGIANCLLMHKNPHQYNWIFESTVDALIEQKIDTDDGICWESTIGMDQTPVFNSGLSHGFPAVLIYLSKLYALGIRQQDIRPLVTQGFDFILPYAQSQHPQIFPTGISSQKPYEVVEPEGNLGTWCYGDHGLIFALIHAGQALNIPNYLDLAQKFALQSAKTNIELKRDPMFCHGEFGIAYLHHCLFSKFRHPLLLEVSRRHIERAIAHFYHDGTGIGGFQYAKPMFDENGNSTMQHRAEWGLLEGSAGIGLVLLSTLGKPLRNWDMAFYTDVNS